MSHDPALVAKVADEIYGRIVDDRDLAADAARAVLDALDLPGIERRARVEALREAASLIAAERHSEVRGFSAAEGVVTRRAAEIDPEEADDDA